MGVINVDEYDIKSAIFRCYAEECSVVPRKVRIEHSVYGAIMKLSTEYEVTQNMIVRAAIKRVILCNYEVIKKIIDIGFKRMMTHVRVLEGSETVGFAVSNRDAAVVDLMSSSLGLRKADMYRWFIYKGLGEHVSSDRAYEVENIDYEIERRLDEYGR